MTSDHPDLRVPTTELGRFAKALHDSVESLDEARRALGHVRADQIGTADLDAACDSFQESWAHGAEQLGERIGRIQSAVALSHNGYVELNRALAEAFRAVKVDG
ncbi:hypothetical protein H9Y04_13320 [Streptomyces sp. TRM66268-LWL]|uniref:ESX-1 secretion-associated protein n=1 Tax=Streptomyces polyasparticus TaxID=2767826 RepID=A0ABR7SDG9_9ACTN|nr:hypothetical protein [Streptomyces polyasparticus]MBC9713550.1 hypothetical protein [Streptomyces polyasparticus]